MGFLLSNQFEKGYEHDPDKNGGDEGGQEDIFVGDEGGGAVGIDDGLGVFQHRGADTGTDDTGDQHLADDPLTLEHTGLAFGGTVPEHGTEDAHAGKVTAEHDQGSQEYGDGGAEEIQHHISCHQQNNGGGGGTGEAPLIVLLAVEEGEGGSQNDGRGEDQHIVIHAQSNTVYNREYFVLSILWRFASM